MSTKKIAISSFWPFDASATARLQAAAAGYQLLDLSNQPSDAQLSECEILFGNANMETIRKMTSLKWVHLQTAGVDWYADPKNGVSENVLLTNSSGAYGISIAEHMLTVTLMLLRHAAGYVTQQQQHVWENIGSAKNLYSCNITVVGMGDIGGRYAELCHAMGASVSGVVRTPRTSNPKHIKNIFTTSQLETAIQDADIVALAVPGTSETEGLFSRHILSKMKKGAIIINVGRGSAIDQDALADLLQNGHLGGAALDVTIPEPLPTDSPLWDMPNVIITPHVSYGGRDTTFELIFEKFLQYFADYQQGRPFQRVVDRKAGY